MARGERGQARVVEAHRDLGREVLEQVPGEPQLREHDEPGPGVAGLLDQLEMAREVGLEVPEARRDLGEGDPERLHAPESRPGRGCAAGRSSSSLIGMSRVIPGSATTGISYTARRPG